MENQTEMRQGNTSEAQIHTLDCGEMSFRYPDSWQMAKEDLSDGRFRVDGFKLIGERPEKVSLTYNDGRYEMDEQGRPTVAVFALSKTVSQLPTDDLIRESLRIIAPTDFPNLRTELIEPITHPALAGHRCKFDCTPHCRLMFGCIYAFRILGKNHLLIIMDEQEDVDRASCFFFDSLTIAKPK